MAFESFSVAVVYRISGNAAIALEAIAKNAGSASDALERLTKMSDGANTALRDIASSARAARTALGEMDTAIRASAASMQAMQGESAKTGLAFNDVAAESISSARTIERTSARAATAYEAAAARIQAAALGTSAALGGTATASRGMRPRGGATRAAGNIGIGGSLAALVLSGVGIKEAAKTQGAAAQLGIGLGQSTDKTMDQYLNAALGVSSITAFSLADSMQGIQALSRFVKDPKKLNDARTIKAVGQYADMMYTNPNGSLSIPESVANFGKVTHMLGAYDPGAMLPVADKLYRASYQSPDSQTKLVNQMSYFGEVFASLMRPKGATTITDAQRGKIIDAAVMGELSLGSGKWGNAYATLAKNIVNPTKPQAAAQFRLGLRTAPSKGSALTGGIVDENGNFDPLKMMAFIANASKAKSGTQEYRDISGAFNQSATRMVAVAGTEKNQAFFKQVQASMRNMTPLQMAQYQAMDTLDNQTKRVATGFKDLANMLGAPLIKPLTNFMRALGDAEYGGANYLMQHKGQAAILGGGVAAAGAYGAFKLANFALAGGRLFLHAAAHHMGGVGVVGHGHIGGGGIGKVIKEAIDNSLTMKVFRGLGRFGSNAGGMAFDALKSAGGRYVATNLPGFAGLGSKLGGMMGGKIAAKFIPGIGELLLLADGIALLGRHSKDVGRIIGQVARWIHDNGAKIMLEAVGFVFHALADSIIEIFKGLGATIAGIFTGSHSGGLFELFKGIAAGYNGDKPQPEHHDKRAAQNGPGRNAGMTTPRNVGGGFGPNDAKTTHVGTLVVQVSGEHGLPHIQKLIDDGHALVNNQHGSAHGALRS